MGIATWNPSDKAAAVTLSNGNLTATGSGAAAAGVRATASKTTGKWYFEIKITTGGAASASGHGLATSGASLSIITGNSASGAGYTNSGGSVVNGFTVVNAPGVTFATNDFMGFAVDFTNGRIWISKNGTYPNSGNPATNTNPWVSFTPGAALFPMASLFSNTEAALANFGTTAFNTAKPSGFSAWTNDFLSLDAATGSYAITGATIQMKRTLHLIATAGAYALTGATIQMRKGRVLIAATGSYVITGASVYLVRTVSAASKTALRRFKFVLQKLRITAPTLGD